MSIQLYEKRGRRYYPWGNGDDWDRDKDAMRIGSCRLIHCPDPGHYRQRRDVTPDTAAFLAAVMVAEDAMVNAMHKAAQAKPYSAERAQYTPEQRALIDQFTADMAALGGLVPSYWTIAGAWEITQAGIDAVKKLHNTTNDQTSATS